jgi:type I restriction enzyme, S subunit
MLDLPVPKGWRLVKLSDLGEVNRGRSRHRPRDAAHLYGGTYPFVQTGDVKKSGGRVTSFSQTYSEDGLAQSRLWPKDTMCITIAANIAETGVLQFPACFPDSVIGFIPDESKCNVYFIEYMFRLLRRRIQAQATGSVQDNINLQTLERLLFPIPELKEQNRIARVLCSFDDKIELNRQTNQTLEQIAQAIFKSWFVDFEPTRAKIAAKQNGQDPEQAAMAAISGKTIEELKQLSEENDVQGSTNVAGAGSAGATLKQLKETAALFPDALVDSELGEIPEGWGVACVDDVCHFQNGYAFKSKEMSKIPVDTYKVFKMGHIKKGGGLNQAGTKDYYEKSKCEKLDRYLIKKGDLLMCMTDMKNNVALLGHTALMDVDNEYILNQRVGLLRSKDIKKANYPFLYILTNSEAFIENLRSRANSGVQVNLSTKEIKDTKFILPSENVHVAFDKIVERAQEKTFSFEAEQEYLASLRDTLLPKLLSGELESRNVIA